MRPSIQELKAARTLHAWLRRVAISAIPIAGLTGCGSSCDKPDWNVTVSADGGLPWAVGSQHSPTECAPYCGSGAEAPCYKFEVSSCDATTDTNVTCHYHWVFCNQGPCGRVPAGLKERVLPAQRSLIAAHLADAAWLEGAAVVAFRVLESELVAHGAPAELVHRARSAQRDEARHYAAMSRLAARFGATSRAVEIEPTGVRTLAEIAVENAVEGCVRETVGAVVAAYQGECAGDPAIRKTMRSIASDEAEHASLGWAIDAWTRTRLQRSQLALVDAARRTAGDLFLASMRQPVPPELCSTLGIPGPVAAAHVLASLAPLWS